MTERERLIELIQKSVDGCARHWAEVIADYLIANGVILPPCNVGDMVYILEPCNCFCGYRTFEECHHRRTKATKWIKCVMLANKHHNRCMKLFERPYKNEFLFKIGKSVFLTCEEAEKALEKMNKSEGK